MKFQVTTKRPQSLADAFKKNGLANVERRAKQQIQPLINTIQNRTRSGVDVNDKQFQGYARKTLRSKRRRGFQISRVSLFETGQMLASLKGTVSRSGGLIKLVVRVTGERNKRIGLYHQSGAGRLPIRRWFGLTKDQSQKLLGKLFK